MLLNGPYGTNNNNASTPLIDHAPNIMTICAECVTYLVTSCMTVPGMHVLVARQIAVISPTNAPTLFTHLSFDHDGQHPHQTTNQLKSETGFSHERTRPPQDDSHLEVMFVALEDTVKQYVLMLTNNQLLINTKSIPILIPHTVFPTNIISPPL